MVKHLHLQLVAQQLLLVTLKLADTPGSVGGVVGGQVGDNGALNSNVATGFADDDGLGVAFSTAVGGSTFSFTYVGNDDVDTLGAINLQVLKCINSASITVPMGAYDCYCWCC